MSETDAPELPDASPRAAPKDPAKARFVAITLIRLSGAFLVMIGLLITQQRIALPWWVGAILSVFGFFDVFVMPKILARKWKTPTP